MLVVQKSLSGEYIKKAPFGKIKMRLPTAQKKPKGGHSDE